MKAEPLKDKEIRNAPKLTCYIENTGMFRKDDVASAVAYFKEKYKKEWDNGNPLSPKEIDKLLNESFEDAIRKCWV